MSLRFSMAEAKAMGIKIPKEVSDSIKKAKRKAPRTDSPIQIALFELLNSEWKGQLEWEHKGSIPNRKFSIDMAFVPEKLAIEVDGWEFHGKYLQSFKNDRIKQNLLVRNGWSVLRFFAEEINHRPEDCIEAVRETLNNIRTRKLPEKPNE